MVYKPSPQQLSEAALGVPVLYGRTGDDKEYALEWDRIAKNIIKEKRMNSCSYCNDSKCTFNQEPIYPEYKPTLIYPPPIYQKINQKKENQVNYCSYLRSATKTGGKLPWFDKFVTFLVINHGHNGEVTQAQTRAEKIDVINWAVTNTNLQIFVVWPGKVERTDIFQINDLETARKEMGLIPATKEVRLSEITLSDRVEYAGKLFSVKEISQFANGGLKVVLDTGITYWASVQPTARVAV